MATLDEKETVPPSSYYEKPYLPSAADRGVYSSIPLLPVEAHTIIVDSAGKRLSTVDRLTLQRIAEEDDDVPIDFLTVRRRVMAELGTDDDWD